jgi:hypothetical protein
MDLVSITRTLLLRELDSFVREIEAFPNDDLVWQTVPGVTNSAGHLAQHVAGNLQHFVGALLGGTGYVRRRDAEFSDRTRTRGELAAELRKAASAVSATFDGKSIGDFPAVYPADLPDARLPTPLFLVQLEAHLAFHLGQAGYLRRMVTGDNSPSGALALKALAQFTVA